MLTQKYFLSNKTRIALSLEFMTDMEVCTVNLHACNMYIQLMDAPSDPCSSYVQIDSSFL